MKKILLSILILFSANAHSQHNYASPLNIPLELSANFGELRPNHFHTGLDLKTQGVVNKPVYSIEDGYISRISVSPSGYGLAIYVSHPATGQTSVYGHLNKYAPKIAKYVVRKQYENERYKIDIFPESNELPVKRGDLIAYSGNTGSSGGPHVHFEIRDTKTEHALDPLPYFSTRIADTQSPTVKGISIYPIEGKGVVNNSSNTFRQNITILKKGGYSPIAKTVNAWGTIGFGVYANDRMNKTTNIYGVKSVKLFCNDALIYSSDIADVDFDKSRMINSMTDFDYWYKKKLFYMKSFIEPGNKLNVYGESANSGFLNINEEKAYKLRYELKDNNKNTTTYNFSVVGKKQEIPAHRECSLVMAWDQNNHYITDDFSLIIPAYYLYNDICFVLNQSESASYSSNIYTVNDSYVPLDSFAQLKLKMTKDSLTNKNQYGIVSINGKKTNWVGGEYSDGYITGQIRELGNNFAVSMDTQAPTVTPILPEKWKVKGTITIKATDNLSGLKSYRGTLNGEYALFEHDVKSTNYTYKLDSSRLKKGTKYKLEFTATDSCDNSSTYKYEFTY